MIRKLFIMTALALFICGIAIADAPSYAKNYTRNTYTITTAQDITSTLKGAWTIITDQSIYVNTDGNTANATYAETIPAPGVDYWPLRWASGKVVKIAAVSATANVVIYVYDQ
jgi:hypothetical protein